MATGDPYYFSNRYQQSSSNYLKNLSEEREKNKEKKKKKNQEYTVQLGGTLDSNTIVGYSSSVLTYSGGGGSISFENQQSGNSVATFVGYNTTATTPYYGGYYTTIPSYIPASPLHGTITYGSGLSSGSYTVTLDFPMIFENDIIKIKDGKVYINDKLEMNPTRIGLALLKALDSVNKESVNDPKDMFNKD